jgi:hypothetical protein
MAPHGARFYCPKRDQLPARKASATTLAARSLLTTMAQAERGQLGDRERIKRLLAR